VPIGIQFVFPYLATERQMRLIALVSILFLPITAFAQEPGDVLLGAHMDLIKSNNDGYFEGVQIGFEGNYFFSKKFAGTTGIEIWNREGLSGVIGGRWYPSQDAYIRVRGLLGANDLSIGGGFAKPIGELIRIEAMTDFYFDGNFTIRAGFAFLVKKK
jgi:hypothetical protein